MPRQLIEPRPGDKRYVRRKQGKFTKSQDDVGRSLSADRRKNSRKTAQKGWMRCPCRQAAAPLRSQRRVD